MRKDLVEKIKANPNYHELVSKRTSYSIKLSVAILVVYFTFILTIAFYPSVLAIPLYEGSVTSIGIPIGIAIIIFAFVLTGLYTHKANTEFDDLNNKIKQSLKED